MADVSLSTMWAIDRFAAMPAFVEAARGFGFGLIELNHQVTPDMLQDIATLYLGSRVAVSSVHAPVPKWDGEGRVPELSAIDEDERRVAVGLVRLTIATASRFGAAAVVIHPGRVEVGEDLERSVRQLYAQGLATSEQSVAAREELVQVREKKRSPYLDAALVSLRELSEYAAAAGLKLGIENRYHYYEIPLLDEVQMLLRELDASTVFYWHDVGHAHNLERLGFVRHEAWLRTLSQKILGVHLHDAIGTQDHRPAGVGEIDFALVRRFLPRDAIRVCEFDHSASPVEVKAGFEFLRQSGLF